MLQAEEIMKKIEKEEVSFWVVNGDIIIMRHLFISLQEELAYDEPDKKFYHLCIVNLVIG